MRINECVVNPLPLGVGRMSKEGIDLLENECLSNAELIFPLSEPEKGVLKIADLIGGLIFCRKELDMGNRVIQGAHNNYHSCLCADSGPPLSEIAESIVRHYTY